MHLPGTTAHEILAASGLQPHHLRTFTFSRDPGFGARLLDILGLYLSPPKDAVVLCVGETTGMQALDHTRPLLAALDIAPGKVLGQVN